MDTWTDLPVLIFEDFFSDRKTVQSSAMLKLCAVLVYLSVWLFVLYTYCNG